MDLHLLFVLQTPRFWELLIGINEHKRAVLMKHLISLIQSKDEEMPKETYQTLFPLSSSKNGKNQSGDATTLLTII